MEDIGRACKPRFEQHSILAHWRFAHWNYFFRITTSKSDLQYMKRIAVTSIHLSTVNNKDTCCLSVSTVHHLQKFLTLFYLLNGWNALQIQKNRIFYITANTNKKNVYFPLLGVLKINLQKDRKVKISWDQKNIYSFALIQRSHKTPQIIHPSPTHTTTTVRTIITDTDISSPACATPKIRAYDNMVHREKIGLKWVWIFHHFWGIADLHERNLT